MSRPVSVPFKQRASPLAGRQHVLQVVGAHGRNRRQRVQVHGRPEPPALVQQYDGDDRSKGEHTEGRCAR